jgi:NADP-dependent 3-hydroxy acid dehydrogenase YdfG
MLLGPFSSDERAEIRQMVEDNLLGALTTTEVFLDQLRDGGGDLVNLSSVAGRTACAGNAGLRRHQVGDQRLVRGAAPRTTAGRPGDDHRARRCRHRAHRSHHPPASRAARRAAYAEVAITAEDIAEIIVFAVTRPPRVSLDEILVRPTTRTG